MESIFKKCIEMTVKHYEQNYRISTAMVTGVVMGKLKEIHVFKKRYSPGDFVGVITSTENFPPIRSFLIEKGGVESPDGIVMNLDLATRLVQTIKSKIRKALEGMTKYTYDEFKSFFGWKYLASNAKTEYLGRRLNELLSAGGYENLFEPNTLYNYVEALAIFDLYKKILGTPTAIDNVLTIIPPHTGKSYTRVLIYVGKAEKMDELDIKRSAFEEVYIYTKDITFPTEVNAKIKVIYSIEYSRD